MEIGSIGSRQEQDDSSPVLPLADSVHKSSDGLDPELDFDPDAAFRARKFSKMNNNNHNGHSYSNGGFDDSLEYAQNSVNVALMPKREYGRPSDRKPRRLQQMDDSMMSRDERYRPGKRAVDEWANNNNNVSSSSRIRVKNPSTSSRSFDQFANGNANAKMNGGGGVSSGSKDPVAEVVSAIKMLREGFVMVEEMKMDMAVEIEKMRMGMELKHNQMLVEMQQDIVDAFAKACSKKNKKNKNKKRKVDTTLSMPDSNRNCESGIEPAATAAAGFETTTD
ncbi:Protein FIP2 [Linum grandiflorum]